MKRLCNEADKREKQGEMMKIIFATGNQNKLKEIRRILQEFSVEIISMKEAGMTLDIEENGTTFSDNAVIKAKAVAKAAREAGEEAIVVADDSGLEIDYLNQEPGVYSARYMGEDTSYHVKNLNLINRLEGIPMEKRTARFVCAMAAVLPDGKLLETQGIMEGYIGYEEKGGNGFGYDPIFLLPEYGKTSAELPPDTKNEISHRGWALRAMKKELENYLEKQGSEKNGISIENTNCE